MKEQTYQTTLGLGLKAIVRYDYTPEVPGTHKDLLGFVEPACPAEVVINSIEVNGFDISEELSEETLERINDEVFKYCESNL